MGGGLYALFVNMPRLKEAGFASPPRTWDELYEVAKAMKKPPKYGLMLPGSDTWYTAQVYECFHKTAGAPDIINEKAECTLNSPETVESLEFYKKLYEETNPPGAAAYSYDESTTSFGTEESAMIFHFNAGVGSLAASYPSIFKSNLKIVMNPKGKAEGTLWYADGVAAFKTKNPPDVIKDFILFANSKENVIKLMYADPYAWCPPRKDIYQDPEIKSKYPDPKYWQLYDVYNEMAPYGTRWGLTYGAGAVQLTTYDPIRKMIQAVLFGGKSVTEAVEEAHDAVEKNLKAAGYG